MFNFITTLLIGFSVGVANQLMINGPHLACCYTVGNLTIGAMILGLAHMVIFPFYYYLFSYLLSTFTTSNMILVTLATVISTWTFFAIEDYRFMMHMHMHMRSVKPFNSNKMKLVKVDEKN